MAAKQDKSGDIVINGFDAGIADDPYQGIGNLINANITSIPGEASVNFATSQISPPVISNGSVTSSNAGTDYFTYTGASGLENYMTVVFSSQSGMGIAVNTAYWVVNLNGAGPGTFQLTTDYAQTSLFNVTGNGTGSFIVAQVSVEPITGAGSGQPKFFAYDGQDGAYFMLTSAGDLWTNIRTTTSGYWTWTGPSGTTVGLNEGSGLAYYTSFDKSNSYVFVFRNTTIDYFIVRSAGNIDLQWVFGWTPSDGTGGHATQTLNTSTTFHNAYVGQDDVLYWCDGSFIGSLREVEDPPPQVTAFSPSDTSTYVYAKQALSIPYQDSSQCLAELGVNLLIGGKSNAVYPWDRSSPTFSYPILLAEFDVRQLVTVNTSTYIFVGNRGRIWVTNGSQANLWKKIPDFLSKTVEPYYQWGGVCSNKNQLYFSFGVTSNAGTTNTNYGGIWAIDIDSKAIRLSNTLSYQSTVYNGYALCLIPNFAASPAGLGFYAGWDNGSSLRGIDTTTSAPYAGGTNVANTIIDTDLVSVGTSLKPTSNGRVEFKLSVPIVPGESIKIQYRQKFSDAFADISATTLFNFSTISTNDWTGYSGFYSNVNFQNSQWIQLRAVLTSTASSPSYARLTEIRLGN